MDLDITEREAGILVGLLASASNEAGRDGRTGPWVDSVRRILAQVERAESRPNWKVHPTGSEPFGTRVTFWSAHWGNRHAVIIESPKPEGQRELFDSREWKIVIHGSGMTHAPADSLTLGWHPDAVGTATPA